MGLAVIMVLVLLTLMAVGGAAGALVVRYLELQQAAGRLSFPDAGAALAVLLGLLTRDWQIRVLVGELPPPSEDERRARAVEAVSLFLKLYGTAPAGAAPAGAAAAGAADGVARP